MVLGWIISSAFKTVSAGAKSAFGNKSFTENMKDEFSTDSFFGKLLIDTKKDKFEKHDIVKIMMKGNLPDLSIPNAYWGIKIYDATEKITDDSKPLFPVNSIFEQFKEPLTDAYDFRSPSFSLKPGLVYPNWFQLHGFFPLMITPPYGGRRNLQILIYLGNADNPVIFANGYLAEGSPKWYWGQFIKIEENFDFKGYIEAADDMDESIAVGLKLAVSVAMADGNLDETEGNTIKDFIVKIISGFEGERHNKLKDMFNKAFRDSFAEAQSGDLNLNNIIKKMNEIASNPIKYSAIELCYKVMSADGVANNEELKTLDKIAKGLKLDTNLIKKIKDKSILELDPITAESSDMESILGINPNWNKENIKSHLNKEFKKWNSRYQNLSEGKERENAQFMLDCIAEARKKYDK